MLRKTHRLACGEDSSELGRTYGRRPFENAFPAAHISHTSRAIALQLAAEALEKGIGTYGGRVKVQRLNGGNTADCVLHVTSSVPLIIKIDDDPNLIAEARVLEALQRRDDLPERFRRRFPAVLAIRAEPPYAYAMEAIEDDYVRLSDFLFARSTPVLECVRVAHTLMDYWLEAYEASMNPRLRPSVEEDYIQRIETRLDDIGHPLFAPAPIELTVRRNGVVKVCALRPWREYLSIIKASADTIRPVGPPFSTFVHGDLHPGNIFVRLGTGQPEMRFIDPKTWENGDYVFDVAKIAHYLLATGPVERAPGHDLHVEETSRGWRIEYRLDVPERPAAAAEVVLKRALHFAAAHADPGAASRYTLGLASNLLGLPRRRLEEGRQADALMLYAEGLALLNDVCVELEQRSFGATSGLSLTASLASQGT